jgi:hypothetical protein
MMETVEEETGPVYRGTTDNRAAAWIVLVAALGVTVWVTLGGGSPIRVAVLGGGAALIAFLAAAALRFQVRAEPKHLVVCWGGRRQRIPWSQIKGFGIARQGRDVYIELADKRQRRLPLAQVTNKEIPATEVRDALQRYWRAHRR